ncbi:hypothetical protein C8F01DRAFT_1064642, partial [Mycena amicta]
MSNHYAGWVSAAVAPLLPFINLDVNPHDHYVELVELGESPSGTTLAVARLATEGRDRLIVPRHVRQRDEQDLLARGATFVAIKIVPILPSDNPKLETLQREINLDLCYEHILGIDSLYLDPTADTLWLRMELMAMSLFRIIDLNRTGVVFVSDAVIAGCLKDVLNALKFLQEKQLPVKEVSARNILINRAGVLKLNKLEDIIEWSEDRTEPPSTSRAVNSMGALLWEMAAGRRPLKDPHHHPTPLTYTEFM